MCACPKMDVYRRSDTRGVSFKEPAARHAASAAASTDLRSVGLDHGLFRLVAALCLLLLLDAADDAPACSPRADHVLVRHRQQVALLHRQLNVKAGHVLHVVHHLCVSRDHSMRCMCSLVITRCHKPHHNRRVVQLLPGGNKPKV